MDDKAISELVNSAVERALGGGEPAKAAPAAPSKPPTSQGDGFDATMRDYMKFQMAREMVKDAASYRSPGAPSSAPSYSEEDPGSLLHADRSVIENLRRTGKFKGALEAYYRNLPGGRGSVFPGRDPK